MKNTFKLIPATLAFYFGGVVLAQPTMAQPTAACIIEKGLFDSGVHITFEDQGIKFYIPVQIEDKKRLVSLFNKQIEELRTYIFELMKYTVVKEKDPKVQDKLKESRKEIDEKRTALKEMVVLLDAITNNIIECLLKQEYIEYKNDRLFDEDPFNTFENFKKTNSHVFKEECYIKYLENERRVKYLKGPFKIEISNKNINNDLYEKIKKFYILFRKHFYDATYAATLQGNLRSLLAKILTSKETWIVTATLAAVQVWKLCE